LSAKNKILITPLNWGLGHATRCIPIIHQLLSKNREVQIASDGAALKLLKNEFPNLVHWKLPSYNIHYGNNFVFDIIKRIPSILSAISNEKKEIAKIVEKENISTIISDNRYGCYHPLTKNILICHQHQLLMPSTLKWSEAGVNKTYHYWLEKFDEHWIPDTDEHFLSGQLSQSHLSNIRFINPLSRFKKIKVAPRYEVIAIVSGPEPQRSSFFEKLKVEMVKLPYQTLIIGGNIPQSNEACEELKNCTVVQFMNSQALNEAIEGASLVVCRSGYSSIMDMMKLEKKVVLIPSPGQTEQIYLAERMHQFGIAQYLKQSNLPSLQNAIEKARNMKGFTNKKTSLNLLENAINTL
jgi:uncharacterized protein (TIGR00661 family)